MASDCRYCGEPRKSYPVDGHDWCAKAYEAGRAAGRKDERDRWGAKFMADETTED